MPDLDQRLRAARTDLLGRIEAPELTAVRARADAIRRRRRRTGVAATALALVAIVGLTGVVLRAATGQGRIEPVGSAAPSLPAGSVWRGDGLTLLGLDGPVVDLPGTLTDVQFADGERGYALAAECGSGSECAIALAASVDGGHSWVSWPTPIDRAPASRVPRLITVGTAGVALVGETAWYTSANTPRWTEWSLSTVGDIDAVPAGGRLWLAQSQAENECKPGPVVAMLADGTAARLTHQPDLQVCRVAPAPTGDGAWWVAGHASGAPAVAVTRDGGRNWSTTSLPVAESGTWAQVSTLGSEVYATIVATMPARTGEPIPGSLSIRGVYRAAGGSPLQPYAEGIGTVLGELVPLLDGRLLAAGPNWYVGADPAEQMRLAGGTLPWVGRLQRSPGGWVAYDLFEAGWVATSADGATWQKINLR